MPELLKSMLLVVGVCLLLPAVNAASASTGSGETEIAKVVETLDLLSFRNSMRPRARPDAHTLQQYGFTKVRSVTDKAISLALEDDSWHFSLRIARDDGDTKVLCIEDDANNGGTYSSAFELMIVRSAEGLYQATQQTTEQTVLCSGHS
ncbi:hypothetical protein HX813_24140 [Pseudomonas yamanorum]|uniref:hypothetical protein n=1 Tax=Pseudomonas yamanorum TaxID=515393 RepID=UPI0015A4196B|nr:hypothetical protein [Pseudomonas yamanorum]